MDDPSRTISELDEAWATALAQAEAQARAAGRTDITDYLKLKSSNDFLRKTATDWLLATFEMVAAEENRAGASLELVKEDNYEFKIDNASMVGKVLKLRSGVRELLVEVGWPRVPRHGFIRGGGLALGNLRHIGVKSATEQLRLVTSTAGAPRWIVEQKQMAVDEACIRKHVNILIDYRQVDQPEF